MAKWGEKTRHFESYWSLGNLVWTTVLSLGSLMAGWLTAAQAWAEGTLKPYGTLGYVATILAVALLLALVFYVAAAARSRWIVPHGGKGQKEQPATETREAQPRPRTLPDPNFRISYGDEGTYLGAHETLMLFVVEHLMPTCDALIYYLNGIIETIAGKNEVAIWAEKGVLDSFDLKDFKNGYESLLRLSDSPPTYIQFQEMINSVDLVENNYSKIQGKTLKLSSSQGVHPESVPDLLPRWKTWRDRHNELIEAYERIKRDSRFGKLFRPARESRWGRKIESFNQSAPTAPQSPVGIGPRRPLKTHRD